MAFESNTLSQYSNIASLLGGIGTQLSGANMALEAGSLSASAFRSEAATTKAIAEYNISTDQINAARRNDELIKGIRSTSAAQQTEAAATGFSSSSQSFLAIMNATLNQASDRLIMERNDQDIRTTNARFTAEAQAVGLENQARAAEFAAETASFNRTMGAVKSGISAFGSMGGMG